MDKNTLFLVSLLIFFAACYSPISNSIPPSVAGMTDTALIRQLGADSFGMRPYVIVFLKQGTKPVSDSLAASGLLAAHLKYLKALMDSGKILILGPMMEESEISGICIYNTTSVEEAKTLAEADPAVVAGDISIEAHPWYSSAAIAKIPEIHKKIEQKSFANIANQ